MKCSKCGCENLRKANFCKKCGHKFSNDDKELASKKGLIGVLNKIKNWYNFWTFKKVTDSIWFKILSVVVVLVIGFYFYFLNGDNLRIETGNNYNLNYNKNNHEYYVYLKQESYSDYAQNDGLIEINLYIPKRNQEIYVQKYDENNKIVQEDTFKKENVIKVNANTKENGYYLISTNKDMTDALKVYVYLGGE